MKRRSYSVIGQLLLAVFTVTFFMSCILVYWLLCIILKEFSPVLIVLISIIFLVVSILSWSFLFVLFSIPQRLAKNFDQIKNNIAAGKITSANEFSSVFCNFLINFYNYSFFDVEMAAVKVMDQDPCFSTRELQDSIDWENAEREMRKHEELVSHGRIRVAEKRYFAYSIPIIFGDEFLGFFTVISSNRLGRIYLKLLQDLENDFVDDQLIHVLRKETGNPHGAGHSAFL